MKHLKGYSIFESMSLRTLKSKKEDIEDCALSHRALHITSRQMKYLLPGDKELIRWAGEVIGDEYSFYLSGLFKSNELSVESLQINHNDITDLNSHRGKNAKLLRFLFENFKSVVRKLKLHIFKYNCEIQFFIHAYGVERGTCITAGVIVERLKPIKENVQNEQLWEFINMDEFLNRESVHGKDLSFEESDKIKIKKGTNYDGYDYEVGGSQTLEVGITNYDNGKGDKKFIEYIKKSPDDWFYCKEFYYEWHHGEKHSSWRQQPYRPQQDSERVYESWIKCDTLEGLIQLIKSRREYIYQL